jgi:hypothetical protein
LFGRCRERLPPWASEHLEISRDERRVLVEAANALDEPARDAFLREVTAELMRLPEIKPGLVTRIVCRGPAA